MVKSNMQNKLVDEEIERKVEDLLRKMTLIEKAGQLNQLGTSIYDVEENLSEDDVRQGKVGSILSRKEGDKIVKIQRIAVEESRLGIPIIFAEDVIHGYKTVFPIPLGEACSFEPSLAKRSASIAAAEARAAGIHWTFAPMVDIARDPRWGRISEGAGEDPYLGSVMAKARVEGFQGKSFKDSNSIIACAKHFAAYGGCEGGRDYNTVDMSLYMLHEVYLPPFKAAVDAGVATVMSSLNELNGVPCTANSYLLTEVLRNQFGFKGFVVSDWAAVKELIDFGYAENLEDAAKKAILAGIDMEMRSGTFVEYIPRLVEEGVINEEVLDKAVKRVLRIKFLLGLFENPYPDFERKNKIFSCTEHLEASRDAARRSMVLLKNEGKLLPLSAKVKKIAVIGPLADDKANSLGSWVPLKEYENTITVLAAIRKRVAENTEVFYTKGCDIEGGSKEGFYGAVETAKKADIVIAVMGESADQSGEANNRAMLGLPGLQEELLKKLHQTGTPIVLVLINGRPLSIVWAKENIPSILEAWQPGTQAGNAVFDVLFGNYNPSGKLAVTFPYSSGQIPMYYNHPNVGRPGGPEAGPGCRYLDIPNEPLYPFGYGLSYTEFSYDNLVVTPEITEINGKISVSVDVTNSGDVKGEEVVQLYISDVVASRVRPVKELKGFKKILLEPGERKTVLFELDVDKLGFYSQDMRYIVEPGEYKIFVGTNSNEVIEGKFRISDNP